MCQDLDQLKECRKEYSFDLHTCLIAQVVKNPPAMQQTLVRFLGWEDPLAKGQATLVFLGFSCGSAGKESDCNVGDLGLIPELGKSPGEGKGYPLQYSGLENSMDYIVHGVARSQTQVTEHTHTHKYHEVRHAWSKGFLKFKTNKQYMEQFIYNYYELYDYISCPLQPITYKPTFCSIKFLHLCPLKRKFSSVKRILFPYISFIAQNLDTRQFLLHHT